MANKKSPAAQAIKDMLELGIDVTVFTGNITKIHMLNAEISIITKETSKPKEKVKEVKAKPYPHKTKPQPIQHRYNRRIIINVDGTVSIELTEWDYK